MKTKKYLSYKKDILTSEDINSIIEELQKQYKIQSITTSMGYSLIKFLEGNFKDFTLAFRPISCRDNNSFMKYIFVRSNHFGAFPTQDGGISTSARIIYQSVYQLLKALQQYAWEHPYLPNQIRDLKDKMTLKEIYKLRSLTQRISRKKDTRRIKFQQLHNFVDKMLKKYEI